MAVDKSELLDDLHMKNGKVFEYSKA